MITTWTGSLLVCSRFCCFFFYFYWLALPPSLTATPRLAAPWSSWGPHHVPCAELAFDATLRSVPRGPVCLFFLLEPFPAHHPSVITCTS
ncbi:hypothetical protein IWX49DRAFT_296869 [Phyllosticta citricarpa]|uniref:Secreted protein n=1 Tax=Phyllosticta citriasiana TaxID=595635 RepID=A0ABR1KCB5_9PEZI